HLNRFLQVFCVHQGEERAEYFGSGDGAARLHAVQDGRVVEVAVRETVDIQELTASQYADALVDTLFDQAVDPFATLTGDDRAHVDPFVETVADLAALGSFNNPLG